MLRLVVINILGIFILIACSSGGGGSSSSSSSSGGGSSSSGGSTNPAPVISAQAFNGTEDTVLTAQLAATDPGDTFTYAAATNPMSGAITVTAAGAFTYTPNANFSGADTFTARVTDSVSQTANATITLNMAGVNDAPTASNDVLTVTSADALNVLANDVDPDNDALSVTVTSTPFVGTATVNANRTVNVALPAGFKGFTKFSYRITDAANITADASALVFVGIQPFKVVTLSPPPAGGGASGIFVNDLMSSRLAHETNINYADINQDNMLVSSDGRGLAFFYNAPNGRELRYVDLTNPGQSRLIHGPLSADEAFGWAYITGDGRFVVYEYKPNTIGYQQLYVFDRNGTGQGQRLSLPPTEQPLARLGTLNSAGTAMYYPGMSATTTPWTCTVYRVDLATRVSTPVSVPSTSQTPAFFWPLPNDSGYVDVRFNNGGGMGAYGTSNANPAGAALLHEALSFPNVYFPMQLSRDGGYFAFTEQNSSFIPVRMGVSTTSSPGSSRTVGGANGLWEMAGYNGMRADSQAMLISAYGYGGPSAIHEVSLAAPETLTSVFAVQDNYTHLTNAQYSADGARITYSTSYYVSADNFDYYVSATRRGAFGQTTRLTPPGQQVNVFVTDASGYVGLVSIAGSPASAALVNVDAPQILMSLGASANAYRGLAVVAR